MNTRFSIVLITLAFLALSGLAVADPCQPGDPEDHKHCRDSDNPSGLGSNISMDCRLANDENDTIKPDGLGWYEDAVDKVDCSIQGPSTPWPIRLGVGGGNGRWANARQVDINLGASFSGGTYQHPADHPNKNTFNPVAGYDLLRSKYLSLFTSAMDPLRLSVRPYRGDPILGDPPQTDGSIHLLTPEEDYEMGMRFTIPGTGVERFSISIASLHYEGNEGFTGIACESGDEKNILAHAPDDPMRDVSVYLWSDGSDEDDFPDGYTVTTGSFERDSSGSVVVDQNGFPMLETAGPRWAAVCSAFGPKTCGNPQAPSNCNFLGYVKIQFTLDTIVN